MSANGQTSTSDRESAIVNPDTAIQFAVEGEAPATPRRRRTVGTQLRMRRTATAVAETQTATIETNDVEIQAEICCSRHVNRTARQVAASLSDSGKSKHFKSHTEKRSKKRALATF